MDWLDRIDWWGRNSPRTVAHRSGKDALTFGELLARSDALASHLRRTLPADRSPLVVMGHKQPEMLIGFLGSIKAGHPYVPVESSVPPHRVDQIVSAASASLILTPSDIAHLSDESDVVPRVRLAPSDPYYVMFTSGSTGEPKGVVVTAGCLSSFLAWMMGEHTFVDGRETFLNQVPFSFDVSVMDLYPSLMTGGTHLSLTNEEFADPKRLHYTLARSNATIWVSTPTFAQMCLAERTFSSERLPLLRRFIFCGETLAPDIASELLDRFPQAEVWNTYGPTETTVATTSLRIDRDILARYSPLPVGYPMPGSSILVSDVDAPGQPAAPDQQGEIVIAGPTVSAGYIGRPDLTDRAFFSLDGQRAYRTGDAGHYDGRLLFCDGRLDAQIKLHGYRIELGDVEANLRAVPGVRDAIVVPVGAEGRVDSLAAFVVLAERPPGSDFDISRLLRTQLGERVPSYMLPRRFLLLDAFPMNINGKADRRRLTEMLK